MKTLHEIRLAQFTGRARFLSALLLPVLPTLLAAEEKQVFLHYDYMVLADQGTSCNANPDCDPGQTCNRNVCRGHSHEPNAKGIEAVVDAFAAHDIKLHIDPNHAVIPERKVITVGFQPYALCSGPDAISIGDLRNAYLRSQRPGEHYAVFGHRATCPNASSCANCPHDPTTGATPDPASTGSAELPGENFVVTLGSYIDAGQTIGLETESGTFMHELGHNFGLQHGGDRNINQKPNYISVMNFSYQLNGIPTADTPGSVVFKSCVTDTQCGPHALCTTDLAPVLGMNICVRIDYSGQELPALNEFVPNFGVGGLDENVGVSGGAGNKDIVFYYGPGQLLGPSNGPIDWDNDGGAFETHVQADINNDGSFTLLTGFNDWDYLHRTLANGGAPATLSRGVALDEPSLTAAFQQHLLYPIRNIQIAIRPGCPDSSKPIAPGQPGVVAVALLGADNLDVTAVEPSSLKLHGAAPSGVSLRDVNGDGRLDLVAEFPMAGIKLHPNATSAKLTGWLTNSQAFIGSGQVAVVPSLGREDPVCR